MPQNLKFVVSAKNEAEKVFSDVSKSLKKIDKDADGMSKSLKKFGSVAKGAGLAAVAGFGAVVAIAKDAAEAANEIQNLSRIAGISTTQFQELTYAAQGYNVEQEKVSDILKDVNDKFGDFLANGAGPLQDFFNNIAPQVGVTAENFRDLSSKDALQLYVDSLEKANVSQAQMTFYMEALASDATALIPLFEDSGKALKEQAAAGREAGAVLSQLELDELREFDESMRKLERSFDTLFKRVALGVAGPLTAILDFVDTLFPASAKKTFTTVEELEAEIARLDDSLKGKRRGKHFIVQRREELEKELERMIKAREKYAKATKGETTVTTPKVATEEQLLKAKSLYEEMIGPIEKYQNKLKDIDELRQAGAFESEKAANEVEKKALEDLAAAREQQKENDIQRELEKNGVMAQHIRQRMDLEKASELEKGKFLMENSANVFKAFSGQSKKAFQIQKALSISETLISTYQSATSAYKALAGIPVVGPALGAAAAAAAVAADKGSKIPRPSTRRPSHGAKHGNLFTRKRRTGC